MKGHLWSTYVIEKECSFKTWKLPKPMRFKSMNDQRSQSLSMCSSTLRQCHMALNIDYSRCAFAHEQNDYYTLWKQLSLFAQKQHQSTQSEEGAQALYHDKRLKDETDLSSISWALETQGMAATLSGLSPSALGYAYKPKTHAKHLWFYTKTQNICPEPLLLVSHTCTHQARTHKAVLSVHLRAGQSRLASQYNCRLCK